MATTVGAVWVDVLPSMRSFAKQMRAGVAGSTKGLGAQAGREIGDSMSDAAGRTGADGGRRAGRNISSGATDAVRAGGSQIASALETAATAAAAAGAGALAAGFATAVDISTGVGRLQAQLGTTSTEAGRIGRVAGDIYASGFGESMPEVSDAVGAVVQQMQFMRDASSSDLQEVSRQAMVAADVLNVDVSRAARAAGQMVKTGLAADAEEAFGLMTAGAQAGANAADDLADTYAEYSTQFRNMGLSGADTVGLMTQGLNAGARDADTVADAIKEFSIEAVAGSDRVRKGYQMLGIDADSMFSRIGKGGSSARGALDETLDALREVEDPTERNAIATELFGTKAEDLGQSLYALDLDTAANGFTSAGDAAGKAADAMEQTDAQQLASAWRELKVELGGELMPLLTRVATWLTENKETVRTAAIAIAGLAAAWTAYTAVAKTAQVVTGTFNVGKGIVTGAAAGVKALGRMRDGFRTTEAAQSAFSGKAGTVGGALRKGWDGAATAVRAGASAVASGAATAWSALRSGASSAAGAVQRGGAAAMTAARSGWDTLRLRAMYAGDAIRTAGTRAATAAKSGISAAAAAARTAGAAALASAKSWGALALAQTRAAVSATRAKVATIAAAVAQRVVRAATLAWTAVQWLLNAALSANPIGLIVIAITALVAGVIWAWNNVDWFRNGLLAAWDAISAGATWLWTTVLQPVFNKIGTVITWVWTTIIQPVFRLWMSYIQNVVGPVVMWLWNSVIQPAFRFIGAYISTTWNTQIKPVWNLLRTYVIGPLATVFRWLWNSVIKPVWAGIQATIRTAWGIVRGIWSAIRTYLLGPLASVFRWLWNSVIKPVWSGIRSTISSVWNNGIKPVFSTLRSGVRAMWKAFQTAKTNISTAWKGIRDAAKKPVEFLVNTIYNEGIRKIWNKVAGIVGASTIGKVGGFARGGLLPGQSSWRDGDSLLVPMRPGEGVYVSEAMRDPYERARLLAVNRAAMRGEDLSRFRDGAGFATGGVVPSLRAGAGAGGFAKGGWLGVKNIAPDAGGFLEKVAGFVKEIAVDVFTGDLGSAVDKVFKPARDVTGQFGKSGLPGTPYMMVGKFNKSLKKKIESFASFFMSEGFSLSGVKGEARNVLKVARGAVGKYPESGGNNVNAITRWYGMNGQPWCAMFISWLFAKANASGSLGRAAKVAHVDQYRGAMPNVGQRNRQPGDVLVYGSRHVNLATSRYGTIGGNEGNNVRMSSRYYETPTYVYRPRWKPSAKVEGRGGDATFARGGTLDASMVRKIARQDPHDTKTPIMRAAAGRALGGIVTPRLYDSGGYIQPGLNLVANKTGRPEPVLTDAQWRALRAGGGPGRDAPLVENHQHFNGAPHDFADAAEDLVFKLRVARRGGVFSGVR